VYHVRVAALDALGRTGDFAEPVPVRIVVDRQPPFIEIQKFVVRALVRRRQVREHDSAGAGAHTHSGEPGTRPIFEEAS
jgi:hypothetical protein